MVTSLYASMCKDETFARFLVMLTGRRQNTLFQSICRTIHTNSYQLPVASHQGDLILFVKKNKQVLGWLEVFQWI